MAAPGTAAGGEHSLEIYLLNVSLFSETALLRSWLPLGTGPYYFLAFFLNILFGHPAPPGGGGRDAPHPGPPGRLIRKGGRTMGKIKRLLDRFDEMGRYPIQELGYSRTWLMFSYLGAFLVHRCTIADYFLYHFYERNRRGRAEFVTLYDMRDIHRKNPQTAFADFEEKDRFLDRFQAYVHRDWIGRVCRNSREEFDAFVDRHPAASSSPALTPAATAWAVHHHSKQPGSGVGAAHLPGYDRRGCWSSARRWPPSTPAR